MRQVALKSLAPALLASALMAPEFALAHPGHDHFAVQSSLSTLFAGLAHPWTGADHLLAMLGVAAWSAQLGGRSPKLLSAVFVASLAVGLICGSTLGSAPAVESLVILSLIVFGGLAFSRKALSTPTSCAVVALFASFHGVAHGAELPAGASVVPYLFGACLSAGMILALATAAIERFCHRAALQRV